jgi:hypothetical protein
MARYDELPSGPRDEPAIRRRVTSSYLRMDGGFERPFSGPRRRGHDANDTV